MLARLTQVARLLLGFVYILNGLNWWWKVLPFPSVMDPPLSQTPPFVQAMIDTGYMFDFTKVVEVATGLMLLANRWVPLALVVAFPVTVGLWSVDFFLISRSLRAQVLGWSALSLNSYLLFAYLRHFAPMLVARATAWPSEADRGPATSGAGGPAGRKRALIVFGLVAVALGAIASGWLIVMAVQQVTR